MTRAGRPERALDPAAGALEAFACELRALRRQAGSPSYRTLAERTHYSHTVLSDAARGERLPTLAVTRAYVTACGGDPDEWQARWYLCREWLTAARPVTGRTGGGEHAGADSSYAAPHGTAAVTRSPRARRRGKSAWRIFVGKRQYVLAICLAIVLSQAEAVAVWRLVSGHGTTAPAHAAVPSPDVTNSSINNCGSAGGGGQQQGKFPWPCSGAPYQVTGDNSLPEWTRSPKGVWREIGTISNGYTLWVSCQANNGPQEDHEYNSPEIPSRTWDYTWDPGKHQPVWVYGWGMNTPSPVAAYNWYSWPDPAHHCNF